MRRVRENCASPGLERERPLDEALAQRRGHLCLPVSFDARVIAEQTKLVAIEHFQPALDRDLPVRMLAEETADDAEPDRLVRRRRGRQRRWRKSGPHDATDERS